MSPLSNSLEHQKLLYPASPAFDHDKTQKQKEENIKTELNETIRDIDRKQRKIVQLER